VDLLHLELDNLVLVVTVGVALGENSQSLLRLAAGDEEARRLVYDPDEDELEDRRESLADGGNAP